jgi:hypothetical protein
VRLPQRPPQPVRAHPPIEPLTCLRERQHPPTVQAAAIGIRVARMECRDPASEPDQGRPGRSSHLVAFLAQVLDTGGVDLRLLQRLSPQRRLSGLVDPLG